MRSLCSVRKASRSRGTVGGGVMLERGSEFEVATLAVTCPETRTDESGAGGALTGPVLALSRHEPPSPRRCDEQARKRNQSLSAAAQGQPGRLVPLGSGGARARPPRGSPDPAEHRLRRLSLVPRDGARVVRG